MPRLTDISAVRQQLERNGIILQKSMGQNFLVNPSVCPRMAELSGIDDESGVIEIGPGIGVLTVELAKLAKRVIAIELDERLKPVLAENLAQFDNTQVIWGDAMKLDLHKIIKENFSDCKKVCVCANLPYYITSPIIMMLLENDLPLESITVMVQLEAAQRMCAEVGSRESGAVTVAVNYYTEPQLLFRVSPGSFLPPPKVDSAVMHLKLRPQPLLDRKYEPTFKKLVRAGFLQRRKTFINSASSTGEFSKESIASALEEIGAESSVRAEKLTMEQFTQLTVILSKK